VTSRRLFVALAVVAAALGLWAAWRTFGGRAPARSPNVLLVTIDTLRWDRLGCYGYEGAATPVVDDLAARGVRFETVSAQGPLTAPSHASILTGAIPPRHGVRDNGGFELPDHLPTLADAFRRAGYRTAAFVSGFPLDRRYGFARGFDTYDDRLPRGDDRRRAAYVERRADATTDLVVKWLDGAAATPWFLWVHYFDPHTPYEPPDPGGRFRDRPYDGEIAFVDAQFGRVLDALERLEARDRTVVAVTADHGEALGEHGEETHGVFLYDATLRVPWVMAGPGIPARGVLRGLARGIDVMPTLLDLAGLSVPDAIDGRSLRAAVLGGTVADEPAYAESLFAQIHLGWAPVYAWRTAAWKLIDAPRPELYALDADPRETQDRAAAERETVDRLLRQLRTARQVATPAAAVAPDRAAAERLRALGYAGGAPAAAAGPAKDPKDGIAIVNRLWHGLTLVRLEPAAAARELSAVLDADPDVHIARRYLAMALANTGAYARAAREIDTLVRRDAATADDYRLLGEWRRLAGDAPGARAALAESVRRDPASPEPLLAQARASLAEHDYERAAATFDRVLALAPGHPEALRGLAEVALARGDVAGAARRFEQILADDPRDADARVKLGVLRVRAGRLGDGLALFREAVALAPENAEALAALGGALAKSGRPADAVPYFERAVAAGPRTAAVLNGLGAARLESGDRARALAAFRESLALVPAQPAIRALVAKLEKGPEARR
jgi:arylsulfatase A-like enzyme/Tfp pilus assembly protein PilF